MSPHLRSQSVTSSVDYDFAGRTLSTLFQAKPALIRKFLLTFFGGACSGGTLKEGQMTPDEATKKLFEAAERGNTAEAQAAINAGAILTSRNAAAYSPANWARVHGKSDTADFLNKAERSARDKEDAKRMRGEGIGTLAGLAGVLLWATLLWHISSRSHNSPASQDNGGPQNVDPASEPGNEAINKRLSAALNDPTVKNRIIEQIKDSSVMQEFTGNPEVMSNLQKLAAAIEDEANRNPESWADRVLKKDPQSLKRD